LGSKIKKRRILIEIPEKDLRQEFGWLRKGMGEDAVRTFLIRHSDIIVDGLASENLIGLGAWFMGTQEADMVFFRNGTYYVVETKQKAKYYQGWKYLRSTVECLEAEMY